MAIIGVALARNAQTARAVVIPFSCEASASTGSLVYQDPLNDNKVLENTNNTIVNQTIGVLIEKPSATSCNVLVLGIAQGFSGLTVGDRIFLSTTGTITQTPPTNGYLHNLGVAVSSSEILFIPNNIRVLRD
jgi:hypothetical protein